MPLIDKFDQDSWEHQKLVPFYDGWDCTKEAREVFDNLCARFPIPLVTRPREAHYWILDNFTYVRVQCDIGEMIGISKRAASLDHKRKETGLMNALTRCWGENNKTPHRSKAEVENVHWERLPGSKVKSDLTKESRKTNRVASLNTEGELHVDSNDCSPV